jgi:integrase
LFSCPTKPGQPLALFQIGYEQRPRMVPEIPAFPAKLPEEPRSGYVEDLPKLLGAFSEPGLRALAMVAGRLGFRKSELKNLLVMQVADGWITLWPGTTKNARGRKVFMPSDVRAAVEACCAGKVGDQHVFTWSNGNPIRDFRKARASACEKAGVPGLKIYDLRRTFVRNSQRKGIPALVAMKISGHLTQQVFDAYDVTADNDLIHAATQLYKSDTNRRYATVAMIQVVD